MAIVAKATASEVGSTVEPPSVTNGDIGAIPGARMYAPVAHEMPLASSVQQCLKLVRADELRGYVFGRVSVSVRQMMEQFPRQP